MRDVTACAAVTRRNVQKDRRRLRRDVVDAVHVQYVLQQLENLYARARARTDCSDAFGIRCRPLRHGTARHGTVRPYLVFAEWRGVDWAGRSELFHFGHLLLQLLPLDKGQFGVHFGDTPQPAAAAAIVRVRPQRRRRQ